VAVPITVPRLGWSMEEGTFVEWLKQDGDHIQPGDPLFVLESDKAAENIEALDAGVLRLGPDAARPGDKVTVGQVVGHIAAEGERVPPGVRSQESRVTEQASEIELEGLEKRKSGAQDTQYSVASAMHSVSAPMSPGPRSEPAISPRARRLARELGVEWAGLQGSGRNGRIRERDVRAVAAASPTGDLIPHTNVRRIIAERMVAGVTQAAPVTLTTRIDAANLVNLRSQFRAMARPGEAVPGYTDLVVQLTAAALRQHPRLQAQWRAEGLFVPKCTHIAVAVDTEAGLFVPVLRDADRLTLREVAARIRGLIELARTSKLTGDQLRDATFTVTNLGMHGIDAFTPIVHLPQSAVLGVGRIVREPVVRDERVVPGDTMTLSLTFDHRVVDGAPAARFLDTLRRYLEQPAAQLIP
jgi:pyruvate dehydrogenase E2 component (dihydrolipoamide acetyltransferase)